MNGNKVNAAFADSWFRVYFPEYMPPVGVDWYLVAADTANPDDYDYWYAVEVDGNTLALAGNRQTKPNAARLTVTADQGGRWVVGGGQ